MSRKEESIRSSVKNKFRTMARDEFLKMRGLPEIKLSDEELNKIIELSIERIPKFIDVEPERRGLVDISSLSKIIIKDDNTREYLFIKEKYVFIKDQVIVPEDVYRK